MIKKLTAVFSLAALLSGCASAIATPRGSATVSEIEAALDEARLPHTTPAEVEAALLPDVGVELPEPTSLSERFDVNTDETPARAFFMALVEDTPYNMVVHPDVTGNISLSMKSVTIAEVLDVISEVYGYAHRETRSGYIVLPATLQSRIFQVDYLNLERSGVSRTRVSSGQVSESSSSGNRNSGYQSGQDVIGGSSQRQSQQLSGSRIETTYKADFWTELQTTLEQLVGNTRPSGCR